MARYPCYLGEKGKEADGSTEEKDTVTSHSEGSDQETQATHRGLADAIRHSKRPVEWEQAKVAHGKEEQPPQNGYLSEQEIARGYDHNRSLDAATYTALHLTPQCTIHSTTHHK